MHSGCDRTVTQGFRPMSTFRKQVGVLLRFPIVCALGILWIGLIWWWIVAFAILGAAIALVLNPLSYPVLYAIEWLRLAFKNSDAPTCPNYFEGYPDRYLTWVADAVKLGFPTLERWLSEGFDGPN